MAKRRYTHRDDFIPAWITRGLILIGLSIGAYFGQKIDGTVDRVAEKVIKIETAQEHQRQDFQEFKRETKKDLLRIEDKVDKKQDKK